MFMAVNTDYLWRIHKYLVTVDTSRANWDWMTGAGGRLCFHYSPHVPQECTCACETYSKEIKWKF